MILKGQFTQISVNLLKQVISLGKVGRLANMRDAESQNCCFFQHLSWTTIYEMPKQKVLDVKKTNITKESSEISGIDQLLFYQNFLVFFSLPYRQLETFLHTVVSKTKVKVSELTEAKRNNVFGNFREFNIPEKFKVNCVGNKEP
jgi:hypothetical protein